MSERVLPVRTEMERIPPYNSGLTLAEVRSTYKVETISKLGSNENPLGASRNVTDCLTSSGDLFRLYPDPQGRALCEALSARFGVAPEQIVLGNGSEDLIGVICRATVRAGDVVTTLYPSFPLHEDYAVLMGGNVERITIGPDLEVDLPALLAAAQRAPRMIMFSNPMNPVGSWLRREGMQQIIDAVSDETLLVIDEAYVEYAEGPDYVSALEDLKASSRNWVILRTFSKAYGLAGLRIGFAIAGDRRMADYLNRARTPFNTNAIAQAAALAALDDDTHLQETVNLAIRERERVERVLVSRGYRVAPSRGNFLFFDCGGNAVQFGEMLLGKGVITKPWKQEGFETFVRVSMGLASENDHFLASLPQ
ncbi:histidinol-phosphate transaminase (plasmid) [Shinella sp. H4-D48]|jgi:histidinol-phosphate aminotransferase|uniref:Histidinol-phosphate aminotransferase n=1 Tax=Shinella sedimenti TaxID=2919913 RepID=A0ABT0CQU5_9HYPH|nr:MULTISPECIES: histidinol-phosphate transaminase [Shinella]MCJ8150985.1 histidinol-phosphate transaminase [Shinella sedimenti]UNK40229.1 histidinol-phosphate transaminase [Shinella sp. H4-D48]